MTNENIAEINRIAWNNIAAKGKIVNPYSECRKQAEMFDLFTSKLTNGAAVLDFGCGNGVPISLRLSGLGYRVTGIDVSDEMVNLAVKNIPNGTFLRVPMTEMEFDEKFDGVVASFSLLLLPPDDFPVAIGKVYQALKPGGQFLIFLNEAKTQDSSIGEVQEVQGEQMFSRGISEDEITMTLVKNKFMVDRIERETVETEEYGKEHTILYIAHKT